MAVSPTRPMDGMISKKEIVASATGFRLPELTNVFVWNWRVLATHY